MRLKIDTKLQTFRYENTIPSSNTIISLHSLPCMYKKDKKRNFSHCVGLSLAHGTWSFLKMGRKQK